MEKHSPTPLWPHSLCLPKSRQWQAEAGGRRRRGGFKVNLAMQLCTRIAVSTENWHKVGNESKRHKLNMWTRKMLCFLFFLFFYFLFSNLDLLCDLSHPIPLGKEKKKKRGAVINQWLLLLWVGKCFNAKSFNCRLLCSYTAHSELCMAIQNILDCKCRYHCTY